MRIAALLFALLLALAAPLSAGTAVDDSVKAQKLDQLFRDLKAAQSEAEGLALEHQIVTLWLDSGDPRIDEWMDWAIAAMDAGAFEVALGYLNNIVLTKPAFAEGWNKRATLYYAMGRYEESLSDIAETLRLEPRHFGAIAGRGFIMVRLGEWQKALDAFREVLALDPQLTNIRVQVFLLEDKLRALRI
jgi:tetratricopeptide (TPR) repeat protein